MARGPGRGRRVFALICATLGSVAIGCALPHAAHAQIGSARYSSMVIDASSGSVFEAVNADELRPPPA